MGAPVQITADMKDLLYRGATARQLGIMFGIATAAVETRLAKVQPNGERSGLPIYLVRDAAPHLAPLPADVVERVVRMNHMNLPPLLRKEYWQGQHELLRVKEQTGDLWRTSAVLQYVGLTFRDIVSEIKLMADAVERDTVLTEPQRETVERLIAGVLQSIQTRLQETLNRVGDDPEGRDASGLLEPAGDTAGDEDPFDNGLPEPFDPFHGL